MMRELKKHLIYGRQNKHRIRTIFNNLKKLKKYEGWSDLVLLNCVVNGLDELGEPYSKNEIYSAFKEVDKNDYSSKSMILVNLLSNARDKSVF